jgi:hypothetical protein
MSGHRARDIMLKSYFIFCCRRYDTNHIIDILLLMSAIRLLIFPFFTARHIIFFHHLSPLDIYRQPYCLSLAMMSVELISSFH